MQIINIDSCEMEDFSMDLTSLQNRPVEAVGFFFPLCAYLAS